MENVISVLKLIIEVRVVRLMIIVSREIIEIIRIVIIGVLKCFERLLNMCCGRMLLWFML